LGFESQIVFGVNPFQLKNDPIVKQKFEDHHKLEIVRNKLLYDTFNGPSAPIINIEYELRKIVKDLVGSAAWQTRFLNGLFFMTPSTTISPHKYHRLNNTKLEG